MNIKYVLFFAGGLVTGAATALVVAKMYFEDKICEIQEEAWTEAEEHYLKKVALHEKAEKNRKEKIKVMPVTLNSKNKEAINEVPNRVATDTLKKKNKKEKADNDIRKKGMAAVKSYRRNVFSDPPRDREIKLIREDIPQEELDDWDNEELSEAPSEGLREEPYVINSDQFAYENSYWDKITLYVYTDGTVVDDSDKPVDDICQLIGKDIYNKLDTLVDDYNTVLVRNEMRSTDYEVLLMEDPYEPDAVPVRDD